MLTSLANPPNSSHTIPCVWSQSCDFLAEAMWAVTKQLVMHRCLFRVDGSLLAPPQSTPTCVYVCVFVCVCLRMHTLTLFSFLKRGGWEMSNG